jgi:hypothetical protein
LPSKLFKSLPYLGARNLDVIHGQFLSSEFHGAIGDNSEHLHYSVDFHVAYGGGQASYLPLSKLNEKGKAEAIKEEVRGRM